MRNLYVVGRSRDGQSLLLATTPAGRPGYTLAADARLQRVLRGLDPDPEVATETPSPREIQALLRAGASVPEVARQLRVPLARVERYAGPVLSERSQMLERIQAAHLQRPRRGLSSAPLGAAVACQLARTAHLRADSVSWSAYRRADGAWVGRLDLVAHGRPRRAEWAWTGAGPLVALDPYAATLGFVPAPGAAVSPTPAPPTPAPAARAPAASARAAPARARRPSVRANSRTT